MELFKELGLDLNKKEVISFVGGGGKTTSIKTLAKELKDCGLKVLITTSTMIFEPMKDEGDNIFLEDIPMDFQPKNPSITILGEGLRDEKLIGCSIDKIDEINNRGLFDYILIEADGAKRKPIKAPESHEPVIANTTTITVGVIGIDAIGYKINEDIVHRPEKLKEVLNVEENHIIDSNDVVNLSLHPQGIFKNSQGKKILFINKINGNKNISIGKEVRDSLESSDIQVIIGDVKDKVYY
jgi:probable selenium-dependent hydroxylase accessory protein YqeC